MHPQLERDPIRSYISSITREAKMDILITDVTEMSGTTYCVAGWDVAKKRMVRPLPDGGHWPEALITKYKIQPGVLLGVRPHGQPTGALPHLTEDTPVDSTSIKAVQSTPDWVGPDAPKVSANLEEAFGGNLHWNSTFRDVHQGVYVETGTKCDSLAAVNIKASELSFVEPFDKLKAVLNDGTESYQLPVSSHIFKEAWRNGGLSEATLLLPKRQILHVRVGLARDFEGQPNKCYLMINGIL
jgi:hypothetical protein